MVGWWSGDRWVQARPPAQVPVQGGEQYALVRLDEPILSAIGSPVRQTCETDPRTFQIRVPGHDARGRPEAPPIAVAGVAIPRPRPVEVLSPRSGIYVQEASALLRQRGVDDREPDIVQVVRGDMDGDALPR